MGWLLNCIIFFALHASHPFYVSMTDVQHNEKEKSLEISIRIFTGDFEQVLKTKTSAKVDLINGKNKNDLNQLIEQYLKQNLQFVVNGKSTSYNYLGFEIQGESVWSYAEVQGVDQVKSIRIRNSLLYDFSTQQINLVHCKWAGKENTQKLNYPSTRLQFEF